LVTGAAGMLGTEVVAAFEGVGDVVGVDVDDFDIRDADAVERAIRDLRPSVVVNCAAYTDVDGAESERELAFAVNADGARNVAAAAKLVGARVVQLSTDYVFDGSKAEPYEEEDTPCPVNAYGDSKLAGEDAVRQSGADFLIVRTAWLYGHNGQNFVETVLRLAEETGALRIVDDQEGAPTNARDLAEVIRELVSADARGVVNATNLGSTTWYGLAVAILEAAGIDGVDVEPVPTTALRRPAARPRYSVLSLAKLSSLLGRQPRRWHEAVREYVSERQ